MFGVNNKLLEESKQGEIYLAEPPVEKPVKKMFIESYGCQMNFSDTEIVASILQSSGYASTNDFNEADVIFVNTCAIRENAEQRVRQRLTEFKKAKKGK